MSIFLLSILPAYWLVNSARSIVVIGLMGAGKSSIGRCLARRTGLARVDTDEMVAAKFGLSIREIFSKHGAERFRDAETEALRELSLDQPAIVVTGGGIVLRPENVDLLRGFGMIVWLTADEETLFERATRRRERPLLEGENPRERFSELLRTREPLYANAADFHINTSSLTHDEVADVIQNKIEEAKPVQQ
jgi:shikimate kinase